MRRGRGKKTEKKAKRIAEIKETETLRMEEKTVNTKIHSFEHNNFHVEKKEWGKSQYLCRNLNVRTIEESQKECSIKPQKADFILVASIISDSMEI
jgi:hypothetical protein